MQAIAQALALVINILKGLGSDYSDIKSAIRVRETVLPLTELQDILLEHEQQVNDAAASNQPLIPTANATQTAPRQSNNLDRRPTYNPDRRGSFSRRGRGASSGSSRFSSSQVVCRFCDNVGHEVKYCRKLQRFLRDNNIPYLSQQGHPAVNHITTTQSPSGQQWMFDSGASHHVASDANLLPTYTYYGGPEEVRLGDGSGHGGATSTRGEHS
ncbi:unnamed protein product [Cuscuta epithymum]|uniref:Uncharacterized protein n=1 Tax=Cuscuta epithymum TaxID=186058 RepID=A0AAV0CKZ0_9ASTE|nr:unnamed protein product [Cuscuta epithymum]